MKLRVSAGLMVLTSILIISPLMAQANSGLKVTVYVHNAAQYAGSDASVTVNTSQDYDMNKQVVIPEADSFYVDFQFPEDVVAVGDEVAGCVNIFDAGISGECESTYNGKEKAPERIDIYLSNNVVDNSGSSSASSSDSSSSSSSSASANSNLCLAFCR